jgi:hypothetical protein
MMGRNTLHSDSAGRLTGIRLEKHDSLKLDRVGCGVSALGPDGMIDNVFTLDLDLNTYSETYRAIKHIELVRQNPVGVYRTSDQNFILGVSRNKGTPLLNDAEGFFDIPVTTDNIRLWLFACEDGYDQTSSEYTIQISLNRMLNFKKLGPLTELLEIPIELFEANKKHQYVQQVLRMAAKAGGDAKGIARHAIDLENAVKKSTTASMAVAHTLHFLKGVGAKRFFDAKTTPEKLLFFNPSALPRAYIPLDCSTSKDEAESLRKITDRGFTIGQAVIEQPAGQSSAVCEKRSCSFRWIWTC